MEPPPPKRHVPGALWGSASAPGKFFLPLATHDCPPPPAPHQTIHKLSGPLSWGYGLMKPQIYVAS